MRAATLVTVFTILALSTVPALAWRGKSERTHGPCDADGSKCDIMCEDGSIAGGIHWTGAVWTDGNRSDSDFANEASAVADASRSGC